MNFARELRVAGIGISAALLTALAPPATAQSDGSLEKAYSQQCPKHEDTQACSTLRSAMEATSRDNGTSAAATGIASAWGGLADLAGTSWTHGGGVVIQYRWVTTGEAIEAVHAGSDVIITERYQLNAEGDGVVLTSQNSGGPVHTLRVTTPRPGIVIQENPATAMRTVDRRDGDRRLFQSESFADGVWTPAGAALEMRRISMPEAETMLASLAARRQAASAAAQQTGAAELSVTPERPDPKWGAPPQGEGSVRLLHPGDVIDAVTTKADAGDSFIWRVACYEIEAPAPGGVRVDLGAYGQRAVLMIAASCTPRTGAFDAADNGGPRNDLSLVTEITGPRRFVQAWFRGSGKKYKIGLTQLTAEQTAAWREQRRQAEMAQEAQGDSGLFGALAAATGAALAGGNAKVVMGAAMKGAELTTDNEMMRDALRNQGDQLMATGASRMTGAMQMPSPSAIGGSSVPLDALQIQNAIVGQQSMQSGSNGSVTMDDGSAELARQAAERARHAQAQQTQDQWEADEAARKAAVAAMNTPGPNTSSGPTCGDNPGCVSPQ